jgi:hypothetical protein
LHQNQCFQYQTEFDAHIKGDDTMNIFSRLITWIKSMFQKNPQHVEAPSVILVPDPPAKIEVVAPVVPEPVVIEPAVVEKPVRTRKSKKLLETAPSGDAPAVTRTRKRKTPT